MKNLRMYGCIQKDVLEVLEIVLNLNPRLFIRLGESLEMFFYGISDFETFNERLVPLFFIYRGTYSVEKLGKFFSGDIYSRRYSNCEKFVDCRIPEFSSLVELKMKLKLSGRM